MLPSRIILTFPGKGISSVPATNYPPLIQMLVALIVISGIVESNLNVPSIYRVPKVNSAVLNVIVHSQGIKTSSPDYGYSLDQVSSLGLFLKENRSLVTH